MAFDENLADRVRAVLGSKKGIEERRMFGGLGFMLHGNILVGVWKSSMIVRLGPEQAEAALREEHVGAFDITGKAMKGWVMVAAEGVADKQSVKGWVQRALKFVGQLPAK